MRKSEDSGWELSPRCGARARALVSIGGKCFDPLSHLASSLINTCFILCASQF